jgi:hypothetical protein
MGLILVNDCGRKETNQKISSGEEKKFSITKNYYKLPETKVNHLHRLIQQISLVSALTLVYVSLRVIIVLICVRLCSNLIAVA